MYSSLEGHVELKYDYVFSYIFKGFLHTRIHESDTGFGHFSRNIYSNGSVHIRTPMTASPGTQK